MIKPEDLFEFHVLTKIEGPLNHQNLNILKNELKSNAACVDSDLGGGAHGHLGLVETATKYIKVSTIPYVRHIMPVTPVIQTF